jgi:hypothetical protein
LGHDEESESIWSYVSSIEKEVLIAEMNKKDEEGKSTASKPDSPKTAKVILNDTMLLRRRELPRCDLAWVHHEDRHSRPLTSSLFPGVIYVLEHHNCVLVLDGEFSIRLESAAEKAWAAA